jgi:hypothetical protein
MRTVLGLNRILTMDSVVLWLASLLMVDVEGTVLGFEQKNPFSRMQLERTNQIAGVVPRPYV